MGHGSYTLGIFTHGTLADRSPSLPFDLSEIYAAFAASGQLIGYKVYTAI